jgi:cholest-4-en-3-one 26-monooxygenase
VSQSPAAIDLSDPDLFADGPPHALFAEMRRAAPVRWNAMHDEPGFWSLTRAAEIELVSRDTERFSSRLGGTMIRDDAVVPLEVWRQTLINMDPPRHTLFRELVSRAFSARRVAEQEPGIRRELQALLDRAADLRDFDLVTDLAAPLPLRVIASMLGVPRDDLPRLFDWNARIAGFDDAQLRSHPGDGFKAVLELVAYLHDLIADRAKQMRDDLLSDLVAAELDGQRLNLAEIAGFFSLLLVAGNETTRHTFSGGMAALLDHPAQRAALLRDPAAIPDAVEEMLRWVSAVMHLRRTAQVDTELAGVPIAAGDKVVMWYVSANRDQALFPDAERFEIGRRNVRHQAFGAGGRHFCLGAGLARLELRVMLEETLAKFPHLTRTGPLQRMRSALFNALTALPVTTGI